MIRIVKRPEAASSKFGGLKRTILASLAALGASAIVMLCMGYNPVDIYGKIIQGSLGTAYRFRETVNKAIPLATLSLGVLVAFKMKFWNIGGEGQFYMGAFGASLVAFAFPNLAAPLLLPLMMAAAVVFAGIWILIPALLKARFSTSETLVTLMLNYVASQWISYLQYGPWKDPAAIGFPKIAAFSKNAILPKAFGIHIGWIIVLILTVLVYILLKKSKLGFEIEVAGESEATARYAGMNMLKITIIGGMISGGLCGIAGMMQASAIERSLSDQLSGGLGFTAVITTWLARLSPPGILLTSFLFSVLILGGMFLQSSLQIPAAISGILQGIILFFVVGSEFFTRYTFVSDRNRERP
ncbi:MAG: ABC transporter permease [Spirochaetaceae bacterium]|jgi:simple sugar transport system permease protein|nr:ABC transporter permease [Spirochaetaceae bacterium]